MDKFEIDDEFRNLLPPLTDDEFNKLRDDINKNGCRDPLVIWREYLILIDGHNRHDICTTLDLPFETVEMSFHGRDEVKMWMFKNQLGRRNLTDFQRAEIALRMKPVYEQQAKERQSAAGGDKRKKVSEPLRENFPEAVQDRPRESVAKIAGVSDRTIDKVEKILEQGTPEIIEQARHKDISIDKAYRTVTGKLEQKAVNTALESEVDTQSDPVSMRSVPQRSQPKQPEKGIELAHEAIAVMRKIALNDRFRDRAFSLVSEYISECMKG